jgi:GNAT superfamily N-acetyltransferase
VDVVIRSPKPEDAEGLALAARDLAEQYAAREPERFRVPESEAQVAAFTRLLGRPLAENAVWLVAEVEGKAVGDTYAELHEPAAEAAMQPQRDAGRRRVYLDYLAVQADYRGRGIGGRLLDAVEQWARDNGAELISTDTNLRSNLGALEFYESHGYEKQAVVLRKSLVEPS